MIQKITGERWKEIKLHKGLRKNYAISNKGRLASFTEGVFKDGTLLKGSLQEGYKILRYRIRKGDVIEHKFVFFHTLVAEAFCKQKSSKYNKIVFKDYNRKNLSASNLQWATVEEQHAHSIQSPKYIKALKEKSKPTEGPVLNIEKVKRIKLLLKKGKTLKEIAGKFGVSDMQIHRIKTGENWDHVKV